MKVGELSYPVVVLDKQFGGSFSICNQAMLETTTPLTIKRGDLQRSFIVDMMGIHVDILSASLRKPRNMVLQALDELILNPLVQIDLVLSEARQIPVQEFAEHIRRAFDDTTFREVYEEVGFDVNAFDAFSNSANSVGTIIQYIIDHSND